MMPSKTALLATALFPLMASAALAAGPVTAITGAMVFDGTGAAPTAATVWIEDGRIKALGPDVKVPRGATRIDARGKALLPGFLDVHTHWTPGGAPNTTPQIATAYVKAGVTTVNDFHQQPESYAPRREWLKQLATPHVHFAARVSTPGGHGADWGDQSTTIWVSTPEAARAAVQSLDAYKPDLIKAFADGWRYGTSPDNTSMDEWTLQALSQEAHKRGWPVLTHTVTVERGLVAARGEVDSLAHGLQDRPISAAEVAAIKASGMAMAPTLAVYNPDKPRATPVDPADPRYVQSVRKFGYALQNVKALFDAGVPIALGTDAGMPGTPHGVSTLQEMELLVKAGLSPAQALVAGTATSARVMRLDGDRGTISPGKRADIVLIDGKPWDQIADVHKISHVFIDGRLVSGAGAAPMPAANSANRLPAVTVTALIDDFERTDRRSALDTLRLETPDGGHDRTVEITQVVPRDGGGKALALSARMAVKEAPYAGFAVPLTRGSVVPVDVSSFKGVRFDLKGDGDYRIRINGLDGAWEAAVTGAEQWASKEIPFSAFKPVARGRQGGASWTGQDVTQVELGGTRPGGQRMWLQVDNISFY
ncbi:imidazolonepropionase-like amidohydrolase [Polymorphobacter multimanifer]|uniref:Imidazolonepropionase-like amidohydrolase n=2 Tax=Polymorphobacter multimanifer TaxID=1070431 RepID=A0A841L826_9SPHN|nr:CIA30 family protein [Polymorphobacter multimanifer]MBB6228714.1 imidazolonepropionase-like amidohydrolase [Polymorphobacter multimanifer]